MHNMTKHCDRIRIIIYKLGTKMHVTRLGAFQAEYNLTLDDKAVESEHT